MSNTVPTKMSFTGNAAANPAIRAANIPSQNTEHYLLKGFAFNLQHGESTVADYIKINIRENSKSTKKFRAYCQVQTFLLRRMAIAAFQLRPVFVIDTLPPI